MKIKNLLLVPLLSAALVATSCSPAQGGDSTSGSDTSGESQKVVTRVTVKQVSSVVVGDVLDFDTLVDVYYDDESTGKDYTLEAAAASKDLVKIEGNKVTILGEGSISINVKAGEQQAKFNSTAISQLKKDVYDAYKDVKNNYKVSMTTDGENFQLRKIHRPNFFYNPDYSPAGELLNGDGMLKFANGHGFEFTVEEGVFNLGKRNDNYDWYFAAMDLDLKVLEMTTLSKDGADYLHLSKDVASDYHSDGYFNHAHYLIYTLTSLSFSDVYYDAAGNYLNPAAGTQYTRWDSIDVKPVKDGDNNLLYYSFTAYAADYVVAEHEAPSEDYEYFGENDQYKEGSGPEASFDFIITPLEAEAAAFPLVEEFVSDPANEPVSKDYTKVKNFVQSKLDVAPHNFTVNADSYFYAVGRGGSATPVVDSHIQEVYLANEDAYDAAVTGGKVGDYGQAWAPVDASRAQGYAVKYDNLYTYDRSDNSSQAVAGKTNIYTDAKSGTFAYLATEALYAADSLFVEEVVLDETEHTETYSLVSADSIEFLKAFLNLTDAGYYYLSDLTSYWEGREEEFMGYAEASIVLSLDDTNTIVQGLTINYDGIIANFGSTVGVVYFRTEVSFSGFGTTAAVNLDDIVFTPVS